MHVELHRLHGNSFIPHRVHVEALQIRIHMCKQILVKACPASHAAARSPRNGSPAASLTGPATAAADAINGRGRREVQALYCCLDVRSLGVHLGSVYGDAGPMLANRMTELRCVVMPTLLMCKALPCH